MATVRYLTQNFESVLRLKGGLCVQSSGYLAFLFTCLLLKLSSLLPYFLRKPDSSRNFKIDLKALTEELLERGIVPRMKTFMRILRKYTLN